MLTALRRLGAARAAQKGVSLGAPLTLTRYLALDPHTRLSVERILTDLDMQSYIPKFAERNIDLQALLKLDTKSFEELVPAVGPRNKLKTHLRLLTGESLAADGPNAAFDTAALHLVKHVTDAAKKKEKEAAAAAAAAATAQAAVAAVAAEAEKNAQKTEQAAQTANASADQATLAKETQIPPSPRAQPAAEGDKPAATDSVSVTGQDPTPAAGESKDTQRQTEAPATAPASATASDASVSSAEAKTAKESTEQAPATTTHTTPETNASADSTGTAAEKPNDDKAEAFDAELELEKAAAAAATNMMIVPLTMPKIFDNMKSGVVSKWHVKVGQHFERGEALCDIETEIADIVFDAPEPGSLSEILVAEGQSVPVGEAIAVQAYIESRR